MATLETARQEAIRWSIALNDDNSEENVEEDFFLWLSKCEENALAWGELERLHLAAQQPLSIQDADDHAVVSSALSSSAEPSLKSPGSVDIKASRGFHRSHIAIAASIILALVYIYGNEVIISLKADYTTRAAETKSIVLDSDVGVELDAASALSVNANNKAYQVTLLKGGAYFNVKAKEARPVIVLKGAIAVHVIGTAFEVRSTALGVAVSVTKGTVRIAAVNSQYIEPIILSGGQKVTFGDDGRRVTAINSINAADIASWRRKQLVAKDWLARDVFDTLKRHHGGTIILGAWRFKKHRMTGVYDLKQPDKALRLFAATQGLRYRRLIGGFVIISNI